MFPMSQEEGRIEMSQYERDVLRVMGPLLEGKRTQAEAARLLRLSVRQVRRIQRRLESSGDGGIVHGLRGRPSNRRTREEFREEVLAEYREQFADFGPTLASEKLAGLELEVKRETLRRWLLDGGLWQARRQRDVHRSRRERRACFGELVQMDTSIHEWTEDRGEAMVLVAMIDDASNRVEAGFYGGETVESHFDLLERWVRRHGRPLALYTDHDSIFEWQSRGKAVEGVTQFGRALQELQVELILAHSPQAKGRVERFFGLAQDRWVKEMRLAKVRTRAEANALVRKQLIPQYNRRFTVRPARDTDAHRGLAGMRDLAAILCPQEQRSVANDYTVRWSNRFFQLAPPALPGLRGGKVIIEQRRNGSIQIRFGTTYLRFAEAARQQTNEEQREPAALGASGTEDELRSSSVPEAPNAAAKKPP